MYILDYFMLLATRRIHDLLKAFHHRVRLLHIPEGRVEDVLSVAIVKLSEKTYLRSELSSINWVLGFLDCKNE